MGLDMYAYTRKIAPATPVDFDREETDEEIFYWRKHPNLHGWMEELYRQKGGSHPEFNLAQVLLTNEDIDELEKAVGNGELPRTSGFFFGQSTDDDKASDIEFIKKAREAINDGFHIYYTSWW